MVQKFRGLLLICILTIAAIPAFATHIVGGVINYTYLGGTRYQVTLKVYRDCTSSTPFDGTSSSSVSEALLLVYDEVTNARVLTVSLTSPVITRVSSTITNPCMTTTSVCVEQGVYTATITLPDASKGYNLIYCRCCRNGTINNISAPGSTGASYYARIPPTNTYHNSNPVYALFPPIYICQNAPLVFNHSATDADGDSLFYELCNSMNGTPTSPSSPSISPVTPPSTYPGLTSVTYISPYSATDPLGSSPPPAVGLSIDPATGVLTGTPPTLGQFVCAICCHEYRSGVEISTTFRDFQFNVVTCPIPIASIPSSHIDPSSGYGTFTTNCDNFLVSFINRSSGATSYRWDFGDLSTRADTSHLVNPSYTYPDTGMYWVTLIAYNAVGCTDTTHAWVGVYPLFNPNFDYANKCVDTAVTFRDRTSSPYSTPISWTWNFGDASTSRVQNPPPHLYATAGTYGVSVRVTTDKGCDKTVTHNVIINPKPSPSFFADTTCIGAPVYFHNTSTGRMGTYLWTFGDGDSSSAILPTHTYTSAGFDTVYLILHSDSGCYAQTKRTINVHPLPVVTTNNDTTICPGARVNMLATGGTTYNWSPGTYLSSRIIATPVATPRANINYTVQVVDANRCQNFDTVHIAMYSNHPDFSFRNICKDTAASFTDLSSSSAGAIIAWNWTFGDGTTDTARNPIHLYAASGSYNVKLKISTELGCEDSITKRITIFPIPTPSFVPDSTCINAPVYFRNTTVGAVRTYNWDFGDLGTSTLASPSHTYTTSGTFNVQLVEHTDSGCTQYYNRNVTIFPRPTVTTSPDTTICPGSRTQIAATGGRNYYWSASSTLSNTRISNPISTPVANINYTVTVSDSNRCQSFDSVRVNLFVNRTDFTFRNICQDTAMPFTDLSTTTGGSITGWTWTFGDGTTANIQNPSHRYAAAGTYTVKLKINTSAGCLDSTTKSVIVHPIPNPSFYPDTSCVNAPVFFHNTTTGPVATRTWDFGDLGTSTLLQPSHTYVSVSTYTVVLTVRSDSGCQQRATVNVPVHALPNVITSPDTFICPGSSTRIAATGGSAYWWTPTTALSNPRISNPIASPTVNIVYHVQVQDTNRCQNFDSLRVSQYVNRTNFSFRNICQDTAMPFTDLSTTTGGTITGWTWTFGDGGTAITQNPSHRYAAAGTYTVKLKIFTSAGCQDSISRSVIVQPIPNPSFYPDTSCVNAPVFFHNTTTGPVATRSWDFGDLGTSTLLEPSHTFLAVATYSVILTVRSDSGCLERATVNVPVHALPNVVTSQDTFICPGSSTQIAATGGSAYWWTPTTALSNPLISNPIASPTVNIVYRVQVQDTNRCQNFDSIRVSQYINGPNFTFRNRCQDTAMQFTDLSTTTGGSVNTWLWRFGDGTTSNLQNPSHLYSSAGTYNVSLVMGTSRGCNDSTTRVVIVYPLPSPNFSPDTSCINHGVYFHNSSSGPINHINWSFGDGGTSTINEPTHTYSAARNYAVILSATSDSGCTQYNTQTLTVHPLPVVVTSADTFICPGTVTQIAASGGINYWWTPTATLSNPRISNPVASPSVNTTYYIQLADSFRCQNFDSVKVSFFVNHPDFSFRNICQDTAMPFRDLSTTTGGTINGWLWRFGDGTTSNVQNPAHAYASPGTYTVTMQMLTGLGCTDSTSKTVVVHPLPLPSFVTDSTCINAGVAFTNTSTFPGGGSIVRNSWNFADGSPVLATLNAVHTFTTARTYNVVLKVTSDSGCTQILTQAVVVHPRPVLTKSNDTSLCPGFTTPIWVRGGAVYIWSPGATLSDSLISNPIASPPNVPETYRVIVADTNRCQSFDSVKVKFWRLQSIDAGRDTSICFAAGSYHDSVQLHARGGVSYQWIFDSTTLSNSHLSNPWARPRVNTYYQVLVTDFHGCVQQDSVQVVVLDPALDIITQTDSGMCKYDTITLNVADQGTITSYLWTPSAGVSNTHIRSPYFYPTDSGMYYVTVRNYCYTKTDSVQVNVYPLPLLNTGKVDSICIGDTFHIHTGGTASYVWHPDPTLTPWNTSDPIAFPNSDHWYYVTGADTLGCTNTDSFLLKVFLKPNAQILKPPKVICFGTPVQIIATGGVRYLWSYGWTMNDSTIADPMISPPDTTTYWVRVTNEHNCYNYDSVRLNVEMPVTAYAAPDSEICRKQELPLHAWGGLYYLWTPSTWLSNAIVPDPYSKADSTITYTVRVSNDCFFDDTTLTVHVHQLPPANAGPDDTIYRNQSTTLTGSGGVSYTWYPNIGLNDPSNYTTVAAPYNTQQYILWVTDEFGCVNTDTVVVNVVVNTLILIPTAFSPNGDGTNDVFRIAKWLNLDKVLEFSVWNRWGEKIWETNDKNGGWDGTFNGRPEPMAVYVWQLKGTDFDGNTIVRSGTVTLLR